MNIALLTAGGTGSRMGLEIPKQFLHVNDKPVIVYTLEAFERHPGIDEIIVVVLEGWEEVLKAYAKQFNISKLKYVVTGGPDGQSSIKNGLDELAKYHDSNEIVVLVHDGNRCLVSSQIISDSLATYAANGSAVACIPCVEAVFISEDKHTSTETIQREKLFRTQTPHVYKLADLLSAHEEAKLKGITGSTASCTLMQQLGKKVYFSVGSELNIKITTTEDLELFKAIIKYRESK